MEEDDFASQLAQEEAEKARATQGDLYTHVDPSDGTVYEWDLEKKAWFPKITEDFLASYHANYGNFESTVKPNPEEIFKPSEQKKEESSTERQTNVKPGEKRKAPEPAWFDVEDPYNTKVYVSGLPSETTEEGFAEIMGKCGMVMKDPTTNKFKVKLYRNADGSLKGDGLCCYIKIESVDLALKILDGYRMKNGELHVERAKFQMKGDYDPTKKPRKKKAKEKEKLKKKIEKLFDWRPEKLRGQRGKNEKTVIIKNMFDPKEFEKDPRAILEYQQDIREECVKCGEVKKVVVYDRHEDGVVSITYKEAEEADECINLMNRRWFAGRQLSAETWDGKTRYKIEETEADLEKRISQWDKFLEGDDEDKQNPSKPTDTSVKTLDVETNVYTGEMSDIQNVKRENKDSSELRKFCADDVSRSSREVFEGSSIAMQSDKSAKGADLTDEEMHSGVDSEGSDSEEKKAWP